MHNQLVPFFLAGGDVHYRRLEPLPFQRPRRGSPAHAAAARKREEKKKRLRAGRTFYKRKNRLSPADIVKQIREARL